MRVLHTSHALCQSIPGPLQILQPVTRYQCRKLSVVAQKVEQRGPKAEQPTPFRHENVPSARPDPFTLLAPELSLLRGNLRNLLGSAHPGLTEAAEYSFLRPQKQLRSLLVLLFSRATNGLGGDWARKKWNAEREGVVGRTEELNLPLQSPDILNEWNSSMPDDTASFATVFNLQQPQSLSESLSPPPSICNSALPPCLLTTPSYLPTQIRLAQITEMVHVASLLHDGIQKHPENTQSQPNAADFVFGNKLCILGGDFLLGRACTALSRLGESEVVELIASVISNLVEGEILRMDEVKTPKLGTLAGPSTISAAWDAYLRKTYLKTASLLAKSARATVILGGCKENEIWKDIAYTYGRNLGMAYQLTEDSMEYEAGSSSLQCGLATAPALYACEEYTDLNPIIQRNFVGSGDFELAMDYVRRSSGIERTQQLAQVHADKACEVLRLLPDSDTKVALEVLTDLVLKRTW